MLKSLSFSNLIGLFFLLCLIFIDLKALNIIGWSWWLVFIPLWGPIAIFIIVVFLLVLGWILINKR